MSLGWTILIAIIVLIYLAFRDDLLEIYLGRFQFRCKRCGKCCRLKVALNANDKSRLKKSGLGKHIDGDFIQRINRWCPFLKIEKGKATCTIYSIRPIICKKWPVKKRFGLRVMDKRCTQFKRPWFLP